VRICFFGFILCVYLGSFIWNNKLCKLRKRRRKDIHTWFPGQGKGHTYVFRSNFVQIIIRFLFFHFTSFVLRNAHFNWLVFLLSFQSVVSNVENPLTNDLEHVLFLSFTFLQPIYVNSMRSFCSFKCYCRLWYLLAYPAQQKTRMIQLKVRRSMVGYVKSKIRTLSLYVLPISHNQKDKNKKPKKKGMTSTIYRNEWMEHETKIRVFVRICMNAWRYI